MPLLECGREHAGLGGNDVPLTQTGRQLAEWPSARPSGSGTPREACVSGQPRVARHQCTSTAAHCALTSASSIRHPSWTRRTSMHSLRASSSSGAPTAPSSRRPWMCGSAHHKKPFFPQREGMSTQGQPPGTIPSRHIPFSPATSRGNAAEEAEKLVDKQKETPKVTKVAASCNLLRLQTENKSCTPSRKKNRRMRRPIACSRTSPRTGTVTA